MNVNIKLSITDGERNLIASKLDGKINKRMVTRKEVNELVAGFMEGLTEELEIGSIESCSKNNAVVTLAQPDLSRVPDQYKDKPVQWQVGWLRGWAKVSQKKMY